MSLYQVPRLNKWRGGTIQLICFGCPSGQRSLLQLFKDLMILIHQGFCSPVWMCLDLWFSSPLFRLLKDYLSTLFYFLVYLLVNNIMKCETILREMSKTFSVGHYIKLVDMQVDYQWSLVVHENGGQRWHFILWYLIRGFCFAEFSIIVRKY